MMSTTNKRLHLLQNHFIQGNLTAAAGQSKTLISAQIIKDGAKEYPEIIDYHPEKKVRVSFQYDIRIFFKEIPLKYFEFTLPDSYFKIFNYRLSLTTSTSRVGVIRTPSS